MKARHRINSIALFLVLISFSGTAQPLPRPAIGIKGGFNYSSLNLEFTDWDKHKAGLHLGAFVNVPVRGRISLQPEFVYNAKGASIPYRITDWLDGRLDLDLRYLDVPLMGVFRFGKVMQVHGGPYVSVLLDADLRHSSPIPFFNLGYDLKGDLFSRMDYGLAAGAGIEVGRLGAGIRYNHGLGPVEKVKTLLDTDFTLTNARNSVWQVSVSYKF